MNPIENDYELLARRLDGEDVTLTPGQQALADEIASDAARLGSRLDVPVPPGVLMRVNARLAEALRQAPMPVRVARRGLVVAAAAVAVVAMVVWLSTPSVRPTKPVDGGPFAFDFLRVPGAELEARTQLLEQELADYQAQLALSDNYSIDTSVSGLEQELQDFMLDGDLETSDPDIYID